MLMSRIARRAVAIPEGLQHTVLKDGRIIRINPIGPEGRTSRKGFRGKLKACILDWSGTTADAHTIAPAIVFKDVFKKYGVEITMPQAREPMGIRKDLHIEAILNMPDVKERWTKLKGSPPGQKDVDAMYADFIPMQMEVLGRFTTLIPGVKDAVDNMREKYGMKIGLTTGFNKQMSEKLREDTGKEGFKLDSVCAGDQVFDHSGDPKGSRPSPFMIYQNMINLGVHPIESVVKVDDCCAGVSEGLNAGCWSVGVANYSNYTMVDSLEHWDSLSEQEQFDRREASRQKLYKSGAHYVIDELGDMAGVIEDINMRLERGETPYETKC